MSALRHGRWRGVVALWIALAAPGLAGRGLAQVAGTTGPKPPARTPQAPAVRPETALLQALHADPLTAPFRVRLDVVDGHYVLSGRVGSTRAHDAVIRAALAQGLVARDELVIDTTEAYRAAAEGRWNGSPVPSSPPQPLYVYPPPLMGRLDDPFYGFEPPLISYPPWWRAVAARAPLDLALLSAAGDPTTTAPMATVVPPGTVELTLDTAGVATLRGVVPSLAQRIEIGQKVMKTPGITQVINLLEVDPKAPPLADTPPPPPHPAGRAGEVSKPPPPPTPEPPPARADQRPIALGPSPLDGDDLSRRVSQALGRRPALASLPLHVATRDGVVTLNGRVPSAYEAMLAYRAAEQTPGVREVNDRLAFDPPDLDRPNPLRDKARPEDLEPYLLAQVRRQVAQLAHVDRLRVQGDTLEIRGTVARADDVPRVEAAVRSIPILRGFRIESRFLAE
jgi:BON domain